MASKKKEQPKQVDLVEDLKVPTYEEILKLAEKATKIYYKHNSAARLLRINRARRAKEGPRPEDGIAIWGMPGEIEQAEQMDDLDVPTYEELIELGEKAAKIYYERNSAARLLKINRERRAKEGPNPEWGIAFNLEPVQD